MTRTSHVRSTSKRVRTGNKRQQVTEGQTVKVCLPPVKVCLPTVIAKRLGVGEVKFYCFKYRYKTWKQGRWAIWYKCSDETREQCEEAQKLASQNEDIEVGDIKEIEL